MSSLEKRLAGLTAAQRALLEQRLRQSGRAAAPSAIPSHTGDGPSPLSFGQQRQWFLQQLEPDNPAYHRYSVYRLRGPLDVDALRHALDALVARHAVLRTSYTLVDGEPVQTIQPPQPVPLPIIAWPGGWRANDSAELDPTLRAHIREQIRRPFDLTQIPPWRHTLYRLTGEDHLLLSVSHHIASDRWTVGVTYRELAELYAAYRGGTEPNLPDLPIQYIDFAVWQRRRAATQADEASLDYWRQHLSGAPPVLALPTDLPRPDRAGRDGATRTLTLSAEQTRAVRQFSHAHNATPFMTWLALFNVLLHHYTNATDLLVGVPIAGRTAPETHGLIGLFINTLVMRSDLSGNPTFAELLSRVRQTALDAYTHQSVSFDRLVETLRPVRVPGHTPLFQVMFDYLNTPMQPFRLDGVTAERLDLGEQSVAHDLSLLVQDETEQMTLKVEYDSELFFPATINRLLGHLRTLLDAVLANANRPIGSLPLLTPAERQQIASWTGDITEPPGKTNIYHLFAAQVARTPNAIAVKDGPRALTYATLRDTAHQISTRLQANGIGPGDVVALDMPRSAEWIASMLGVLQCGAAYLSVDPDTPEARRAFQMDDAGVAMCIQRPDETHGVAFIPREPSAPRQRPASTAYIIYTSGSTGQPKGIAVPQLAAANFVADAVTRYQLSATDRVLQFASPAFDTTVEEIFPSLAAGATLVLRPPSLPDTFAQFARQLVADSVTVLDLPTAFWHSWVTEMMRDRHPFPATVRLLIVGGEAARLDLYRQWRALVGPDVRWVNTYGPSEATVVATTFEPAVVPEHTMPIGRPIRNVQVAVIDPYDNLAPIGVPGELVIGGVGVASGYLNQPDLTASRFTPPPASLSRFAAPLYRTGDRVRWLPDGNLAFIGRIDNQVKIRGVRVEPAEIEATLRLHAAVNDAVVLAQAADSGDDPARHLTATVVTAPGASVTPAALRAHLATRLPDVMLPARFTLTDVLPLTPTGKIDRQALSATTTPRTPTVPAEPSSSAEKVMTTLWADLLGTPTVRLHDNFFDLGGHSLLAVQLVSRIQATLRRPLTLRALFDAPTPSGVLHALAPTPEAKQQLERVASIVLHVAQLSDGEAKTRLSGDGSGA